MKKLKILCVTTLCILSFGTNCYASVYPSEVFTYGDNGNMRIDKEYMLTFSDDASKIPTEDFEVDGYVYSLVDIIKDDTIKKDVKSHIETQTSTFTTSNTDTILSKLEKILAFEGEDGYIGELVLDVESLKVEVSKYSSKTTSSTITREYNGMSNADLSYIPKTTTDNGVEYKLDTVEWSDTGSTFSAKGYYIGSIKSSYPSEYKATYNYIGDVAKILDTDIKYTASFVGIKAELTENFENLEESEEKQENIENKEQINFVFDANIIILIVLIQNSFMMGAFIYFLTKKEKKESEKL